MTDLLLSAGPALYALLGLAGLWALVTLVWAGLSIGRFRLPAPLWWFFPGLTLAVGGFTAGFAPGPQNSATLLGLTATLTACGLLLSAPLLAIGNIARAGDFPKWKPGHAAPALIGLIGVVVGLASGPFASLFALIGTVSIGLAAVRLGTGDDRRRMVAGRAFIGSIATCAALALALAHFLHQRLSVLDIWATAPYSERAELLSALDTSLLWGLIGDLGVALALALAAAGTLVPVTRALLDGRTSGGFLFSTFLAILPAAGVAPALLPLLQIEGVDELAERQIALRRAGIDLVQTEATAAWTPGTPVTVGVYWVTLGGERVLPFKDGRVDSSQLENGYAMPIAEAITPFTGGPIRLEIDRRTDLVRLSPVLLALRREGVDAVCFVVRSPTGAPGCLDARLSAPSDESTQILLRSTDATLIDGESEPEPIDLAADAERLSSVSHPAVLHLDRSVSAQRLLEALSRINRAGEPPLLGL